MIERVDRIIYYFLNIKYHECSVCKYMNRHYINQKLYNALFPKAAPTCRAESDLYFEFNKK